jgi:hypothetical protein
MPLFPLFPGLFPITVGVLTDEKAAIEFGPGFAGERPSDKPKKV